MWLALLLHFFFSPFTCALATIFSLVSEVAPVRFEPLGTSFSTVVVFGSPFSRYLSAVSSLSPTKATRARSASQAAVFFATCPFLWPLFFSLDLRHVACSFGVFLAVPKEIMRRGGIYILLQGTTRFLGQSDSRLPLSRCL